MWWSAPSESLNSSHRALDGRLMGRERTSNARHTTDHPACPLSTKSQNYRPSAWKNWSGREELNLRPLVPNQTFCLFEIHGFLFILSSCCWTVCDPLVERCWTLLKFGALSISKSSTVQSCQRTRDTWKINISGTMEVAINSGKSELFIKGCWWDKRNGPLAARAHCWTRQHLSETRKGCGRGPRTAGVSEAAESSDTARKCPEVEKFGTLLYEVAWRLNTISIPRGQLGIQALKRWTECWTSNTYGGNSILETDLTVRKSAAMLRRHRLRVSP